MNEDILSYMKATYVYDPITGHLFSRRNGRLNRVGHVSSRGYEHTTVIHRKFVVHRIAWFLTYGNWPPRNLDIDHINGNKLDNRIANLRLVTRSENQQNRRKTSSRKQNRLIGAYLIKKLKSKPWRSAIKVNGVLTELGYFATEQEAHDCYMQHKRTYHPSSMVHISG